MGCGTSGPRPQAVLKPRLALGACTTLPSLSERAPDLLPITTQLELETRKPFLRLDDLHEHFLSMAKENGEVGGVLGFESFAKRILLHGTATPLILQVFQLIDLNESGAIDFMEFLHSSWTLCLLQDNDNLLRCMYQVYSERPTMRWSEMHTFLQELQGENFVPKMWWTIKKVLSNLCEKETYVTLPEFAQAFKPLKQLLMPLYSMRDELRDRFFGEALWHRAYRIRRRSKHIWEKAEISKLQIIMLGLREKVKQDKKVSKIPVKHKAEADAGSSPGNLSAGKVGFSVGRSTLAKAYGGESSLTNKGRAEEFSSAKMVRIKRRQDKHYIPANSGMW